MAQDGWLGLRLGRLARPLVAEDGYTNMQEDACGGGLYFRRNGARTLPVAAVTHGSRGALR